MPGMGGRLLAFAVWGVLWAGRAGAATVFIGGAGPGYGALAEAGVRGPLVAAGVGLYQHANGNAALGAGARAALAGAWPGETMGEIGGFVPVPAGYLAYFGGRYPAEVLMNVVTGVGDGSGVYVAGAGEARPGARYTGFVTTGDLAAMEAAFAAARGVGAVHVAPVLTPNGGGEDLDDPFATAPFWAQARAAAVAGGGIGLDVPPSYWAARGAAYQATVVQMLRWAAGRGVPSRLIVSPFATAPDAAGHTGPCGWDPGFAANTARLRAALAAAGALPSVWVVENYGPAGPGCGTENGVGVGGDTLNAVALRLAGG